MRKTKLIATASRLPWPFSCFTVLVRASRIVITVVQAWTQLNRTALAVHLVRGRRPRTSKVLFDDKVSLIRLKLVAAYMQSGVPVLYQPWKTTVFKGAVDDSNPKEVDHRVEVTIHVVFGRGDVLFLLVVEAIECTCGKRSNAHTIRLRPLLCGHDLRVVIVSKSVRKSPFVKVKVVTSLRLRVGCVIGRTAIGMLLRFVKRLGKRADGLPIGLAAIDILVVQRRGAPFHAGFELIVAMLERGVAISPLFEFLFDVVDASVPILGAFELCAVATGKRNCGAIVRVDCGPRCGHAQTRIGWRRRWRRRRTWRWWRRRRWARRRFWLRRRRIRRRRRRRRVGLLSRSATRRQLFDRQLPPTMHFIINMRRGRTCGRCVYSGTDRV